jgi:hypothetical protein
MTNSTLRLASPSTPDLTLEVFDINMFGLIDVPGDELKTRQLAHSLIYTAIHPCTAYYGRAEEFGVVLTVDDKVAHACDHVPGLDNLPDPVETYVWNLAVQYYMTAACYFENIETRTGRKVQLVLTPEKLRGVAIVY